MIISSVWYAVLSLVGYFHSGFMWLWRFCVWAAGKGHKSQAVGHVVELCPQTNLMVGVYLAAVLFFSLNNYKAFF